MATKQVIHGIYDDEVPLLEGCKKLRDAGIRVKDVFSPFPIHACLSFLLSNYIQ